MICPNCQNQVPEAKKFCGYCGSALAPTSASEPSPVEEADSQGHPQDLSSPEPDQVLERTVGPGEVVVEPEPVPAQSHETAAAETDLAPHALVDELHPAAEALQPEPVQEQLREAAPIPAAPEPARIHEPAPDAVPAAEKISSGPERKRSKRWLWFGLGAAGLVVLGFLLRPFLFSPGISSGAPVLETVEIMSINIFSEGYLQVKPNQEVILETRWLADSVALVEEYTDSFVFDIWINGIHLASDNCSWSEPEIVDDSDGDGDNEASVMWNCPLGTLTSGTHLLTTEAEYLWPLTDGLDLDGDGTLDEYSGTLSRQIEIEVSND
jgi:hypothetical protein